MPSSPQLLLHHTSAREALFHIYANIKNKVSYSTLLIYLDIVCNFPEPEFLAVEKCVRCKIGCCDTKSVQGLNFGKYFQILTLEGLLAPPRPGWSGLAKSL